jgi:dTDP-glucose 4,6-dehydratase
MRVIVTGGSGFIGSHLIRCLLGAGHQVLNVDKLTYAANPLSLEDVAADPAYEFLEADICDRHAMEQAMASYRPDVIANLAAESHVDRSIEDPSDFLTTNILGSCILFQSALEHWNSKAARTTSPKFVHISTDEVFGSLLPGEPPFTESTPFDPSSPYSASKAASDLLARAWQKTYGLPVIITHCSNNFGPHQYPEKLIPVVITRALRGEKIPVYGNGQNVRDWIYVEDHVSILTKIIQEAPAGESYNIGGENEIPNIDLIFEICSILDRMKPREDGRNYREQIAFVSDRLGHDQRYAVDNSKLRSSFEGIVLGDWRNNLEKTIGWYLLNPTWWGRGGNSTSGHLATAST